MNARNKLNSFWIFAAIVVALVVVNTASSGLIFLVMATAVIAWASSSRHIR